MKQIILAALLCAPVWASAAPFVVSDVTTQAVTNYLCSIDAGADQNSVPETVAGGVRVKFDLAGLASGSHTVTCKAQNTLWGVVSASSTPPFTVIKPASLTAPTTLIIVP